ncbi:hypothetical protein [Nocardia wallacei]|uniref:hypothetical protein n=1 Tax=Nocardia wallacei TaxID=480035 RepID=UPI002453D2F4|nr:hypothetical protein [Nocardia wallacei]
MPAPPPRLPADLIVRLVATYTRHHWPLPICHADDVLPMLDRTEPEIAAAAALIEAGKVFYPE